MRGPYQTAIVSSKNIWYTNHCKTTTPDKNSQRSLSHVWHRKCNLPHSNGNCSPHAAIITTRNKYLITAHQTIAHSKHIGIEWHEKHGENDFSIGTTIATDTCWFVNIRTLLATVCNDVMRADIFNPISQVPVWRLPHDTGGKKGIH